MALASVPVQEDPWLEGSGASRQRSLGWGSHTAALQPASGFDSFEYAIVFTIGQIVKFGVLQVVAKLRRLFLGYIETNFCYQTFILYNITPSFKIHKCFASAHHS